LGGWLGFKDQKKVGWVVGLGGLVRLLRWLGWVGHEPSAVPVGGCCE